MFFHRTFLFLVIIIIGSRALDIDRVNDQETEDTGIAAALYAAAAAEIENGNQHPDASFFANEAPEPEEFIEPLSSDEKTKNVVESRDDDARPFVTVLGQRYRGIVALDAANITTVLAETPHALVLFYAEWDIASLALLEALTHVVPFSVSSKVRMVLHNLLTSRHHDNPFAANRPKSHNVSIFAVDAFLSEFVRLRYGVNRFPVLYFSEVGFMTAEYKGLIRPRAISDYLERMLHFSGGDSLRNSHEFHVALGTNEVCLVVYAPTNSSGGMDEIRPTLALVAQGIPVYLVYADRTTAAEPYLAVMDRVHAFQRHETTLVSTYRKRTHHNGVGHPDFDFAVFQEQLGEAALLRWVQKETVPYILELTPRNFEREFREAKRSDGGMVILVQKDAIAASTTASYLYHGTNACLENLRHVATTATAYGTKHPLRYYYIDNALHSEFTRRLCVDVEHIKRFDAACEYITILASHLPDTFITHFAPLDAMDLVDNHPRCHPSINPINPSRRDVLTDALYPNTEWLRVNEDTIRPFLSGCDLYLETDFVRHEVRKANSVWVSNVYTNTGVCLDDTKPFHALIVVTKPNCGFCQQLVPAMRLLSHAVQSEGIPLKLGYVNVERDGLPRDLAHITEGFPEIVYVNQSHAVVYGGLDRTHSGVLHFVSVYSGIPIESASQSVHDRATANERFKKFRVGTQKPPKKLEECPDEL